VNRADPTRATSLAPADYQAVFDEAHSFLVDPQHGLEQLYAIVRHATAIGSSGGTPGASSSGGGG
jgi:hypothetical protein